MHTFIKCSKAFINDSIFHFTAKLRNLLSQTEPLQSNSNKKQSSLHHNSMNQMLTGNGSFLPPLSFLSFPQNFRDRSDVSSDKGSSLLLGNGGQMGSNKNSPFSMPSSALASSLASAMSSPVVNPGMKGQALSHKGSEPPPAHQNLSTRSSKPGDTLDLRFSKTSSSHPVAPPVPAHKYPSPKNTERPSPARTPSTQTPTTTPGSVLDLSSGPTVKKSRSSTIPQSSPPTQNSSSPRGKAGKRISRIDDLAFTLRQKKMMQEKHVESPHARESQEIPPARELKARSELAKVETRSSSSVPSDRIRTPPAAHSSSMSSSLSSALMGGPLKMGEKPGLFTPKGSAHTKESSHPMSSMHNLSQVESVAKVLQANATFAEQTAALKKFLEEHPDLLTSPTFANALALNSSSIPANVSKI